MVLTDYDRMPFGQHKNEKMANVPAKYLLWLYDEWTQPNPRFGFVNKDVKAYIEENMDVLKQEINKKADKK